jgi:hypothetical protein
MDDSDRELDDVDDRELGAMLRRHADALTGPVDTDLALAAVRRRVRSRRRWRVAMTTGAAVAATAVIVVGAGLLTGDSSGTVRTPAASIDGPATVGPSTVAPTPRRATAPPTSVPRVAPPRTSAPPATGAPTTAPPTSPPTTSPPAPSPTTTTFSSAGGSIVVTRSAGSISLAGDPAPSVGWSVRIDDDGPTRVRVRFERGSRRSEIRVDLRGDELVPEIIEQ